MRNTNQKRRNAIIAAALGAALLMGGGTYALWSASADLGGAKITAGDLNITTGDNTYMYDISADSLTAGSPVAISYGTTELGDLTGIVIDNTFVIVPGDTIAFVYSYDITLVGDNIAAELSIDSETTEVNFPTESLTFSFNLFDEDGDLFKSGSLDDIGGLLYTFDEPTEESIYLVFMVTFDSATSDRDDVTEVLSLGDLLSVTLTQVRGA